MYFGVIEFVPYRFLYNSPYISLLLYCLIGSFTILYFAWKYDKWINIYFYMQQYIQFRSHSSYRNHYYPNIHIQMHICFNTLYFYLQKVGSQIEIIGWRFSLFKMCTGCRELLLDFGNTGHWAESKSSSVVLLVLKND